MKLYITSRMRLSELRKLFRRYYPYLQPQLLSDEYCGNAGATGGASSETLGGLAGRDFNCELDIDRTSTVAAVEEGFRKLCGLCIQIFRRGPHYWEDILQKDLQTLEQQNNMGRVVSRGMYESDLLL
ncbi:MAG: hypothetical protein EOO16_01495 [Chitinophagaceae bacterium]|nr:MAG: hypothetical protein EOO16_01495 [Chitinophagaceae bacterium]